MKLIRFGAEGQEKPGVQLNDGTRIDVSAFGQDYTEAFFGGDGIERLTEWLKENESNCPKVGNDVRLGAPLCRPSKIVCVGLNYENTPKKVVWLFQQNLYYFLRQQVLL